MADDFTKRKFAWLDQVAHDRGLSGDAFRLAYVLASDHLNRGTGDAWPSQQTLADKIGCSVRWVKCLTDQLVASGHITVTVGSGRGHANRYAPVIKAGEPDGADSEGQAGASLFRNLDDGATPAKPARSDSDVRIAFEEWWLQFPRKVGRGHARRAYDRIITTAKATTAELLTGALRYAAERDGQDQKYTKHPSTWLNGECWRDETAARVDDRGGRPAHGTSRATGTMSAIAGIASWLDNEIGEDP